MCWTVGLVVSYHYCDITKQVSPAWSPTSLSSKTLGGHKRNCLYCGCSMTIHFADIEAELDSATAQDGPFQKCLACWHPDSCLEIGPAQFITVEYRQPGRMCMGDAVRQTSLGIRKELSPSLRLILICSVVSPGPALNAGPLGIFSGCLIPLLPSTHRNL